MHSLHLSLLLLLHVLSRKACGTLLRQLLQLDLPIVEATEMSRVEGRGARLHDTSSTYQIEATNLLLGALQDLLQVKNGKHVLEKS